MDTKTYEYMNERVKAFKDLNGKISIINKRIIFYKTNRVKDFGQTNNYIGGGNLGKRLIDNLTKMTLEVLEAEKELLTKEIDEI